MKEIIYDKLVRDKIPEIIEKLGKHCKIEILSDEKYLEMIDKKLDEELAEYHKDKNLEELADEEKEHILSVCDKKLHEYYERIK